ncbi:unnamed protein product [Ostreobium quekettii]|uniref:Uncharacterized protein n=1 Tax=Ostreobium quekettii TaxID=121088 RepID=A0A8S1J096_9CHLO|nr:unnamed protein product [Ostreobium quekettii]
MTVPTPFCTFPSTCLSALEKIDKTICSNAYRVATGCNTISMLDFKNVCALASVQVHGRWSAVPSVNNHLRKRLSLFILLHVCEHLFHFVIVNLRVLGSSVFVWAWFLGSERLCIPYPLSWWFLGRIRMVTMNQVQAGNLDLLVQSRSISLLRRHQSLRLCVPPNQKI